MSCVRPLEGWLSRQPTDRGRYPVVFGLHVGNPDSPVDVPCGECIGCRKDHATAWAVRCYHESTLHAQNCFATLTYRDAPPKLQREDLQRFFKRLRKAGCKFRYFAVGEYGSRTARPHYHVLFFGQDFREGSVQFGDYYASPFVTAHWQLGFTTIAPCEAGSIFYTTGYALKNVGESDVFQLCSRRPFIGHGWLRKYHDDIRRNGFVTIDGVRRPVPASYLRRPEVEFELDELRDRRRELVRCMSPEERWDARSRRPGYQVNLQCAADARRRGEL